MRCELERGIAAAGPSHPIGSSARCRRADRLLAVGAALGFGQLVAALLSPVSSPFLAVGDTVINYSPEPVTEFAKVQLGTNDKPILLSGMAVVIALVGAVAGLLSRRRVGPGVTVVAVLGVAGLLAVVLSPVFRRWTSRACGVAGRGPAGVQWVAPARDGGL